MRLKTIALAVGVLFALPAAAQQVTFSIRRPAT